MKKSSRIISDILIIFLIAFMVGTAEVSGEKEIIFPEIAALTVGALAAPKRSWRTSRVRMMAAMTVCSLLGLGISVLVPLPAEIKISFAFVLCQVLYLFSGTTFAPMISAAVIMIAVVRLSEMCIPPAGALAILPMIIPEESLIFYPLQIMIGAAFFMACAKIIFREKAESKQCGSEVCI